MKTDLEKIKHVIACFGFGTETRIRNNEVELAVYDWDKYLGGIYFNLDGSLITWDY